MSLSKIPLVSQRFRRRTGKQPIDFGLYVKAHPDALTVTALNKMYHTESRTFSVSYDGKLVETYILPDSAEKTQSNRSLLQNMFASLADRRPHAQDATKSYSFSDVHWSEIQDFIFDFQVHDDLAEVKGSVARFVREIQDIFPLWDVGFVSLRDGTLEDGFMIAAQQRTIGTVDGKPDSSPRIPISESGWFTGNKNRFSGNSMFRIGMSDEQLAKAVEAGRLEDRTDPQKLIFRDYTNGRGKPLLLLHLLNLVDSNKQEKQKLVPAISVSFPNSSVFRTVDYIVNQVWLNQLRAGEPENQEEEDDFDPESLG